MLDDADSRHLRQLFLALAGVLLGFGLLMVYSSSVTSRPTEFERIHLGRQLLFLGIGLAAGMIAGTRPPAFWHAVAPWVFAATLLMLLAVWVPGMGVKVKGARRWIKVLGLTLQPSEIAKITLPLMTAHLLLRQQLTDLGLGRIPSLHSWRSLAALVPAMILLPLVLIQPDLGTALFLAAGVALLLFLAGWPLRNFIMGGLTLLPACGMMLALKPYQQRRISGFIAAWFDAEAAPYQLKQSLLSLGSGGIEGVGIGKGWQKLSYLPEANTDFVVAVIGEELGLIGTLSLIAVWCALYITGLRLMMTITARTPMTAANETYEELTAAAQNQLARTLRQTVGITLLTQLVAQAMINVAVVTAMVPPKGISHPLVSCGGSNLVVSLLTLGILVSLSREPIRTAATSTQTAPAWNPGEASQAA